MSAPIGEFEVLILMAVLRLDGGGYAPAVRDDIERRTGRAVSRGAVYITLDRLETKGLLASKLAGDPPDAGGRARRYYRVSPKGVRAIKRTLAALEQMSDGLAPILARA
jgi:DNA-binding PadR family transcriptional regulator